MELKPIAGARAVAEQRWPWRLAVAFVLLTLMALIAVPWVVQRRVDAVRAEIAASEPARTLAMQWQFQLVREMSALSDLLLTGDTAQAVSYDRALAAEQAIHPELALLAGELGPEVQARFAAARLLADRWHERVNDESLLLQRAAGTRIMEIPRERQLFEELLQAVGAVDSAIVWVTETGQAQIVAAEHTGLTITFVLGVLTLLAAAAVIALEARLRRFAGEAVRQRGEADEALAGSARVVEARNRLLRGITHDVKNPLGAAKGYAELLALEVKAPLAAEQAPLVDGIRRSIDSALAIIADLLDLARMDRGAIRLQRVEVDLNALTQEAVHDFEAAAGTAGHVIEAETAPEPLVIQTDPARVRQVLDNLLSNALKYTPAPGLIVVRVRPGDDGSGPGPGDWATLEVSDSGPGIPPEQREAVFDEFTRLDDASPTKGHGLGLAIARGLSRRLGGDLTIADIGPGATFVLSLPCGRADDGGPVTEHH